MAFSEFEEAKYRAITEEFVEAIRPPEHIRNQLDIKYSLDGQSIIIYEVRPVWDDPSKIIESEVAKITYVKTANCWKLYWMRADLKWHSYAPVPDVETLKEGLQVVKNDKLGCFWG